MALVSCSSTDDDIVEPKEQSITAANFESYTSYSDNGYTNIQFGDVVNNSFSSIVKVEGIPTTTETTEIRKKSTYRIMTVTVGSF